MNKKYITVLDFEVGRVFQYKVKDRFIDNGDYEEFISNKGHRLNKSIFYFILKYSTYFKI